MPDITPTNPPVPEPPGGVEPPTPPSGYPSISDFNVKVFPKCTAADFWQYSNIPALQCQIPGYHECMPGACQAAGINPGTDAFRQLLHFVISACEEGDTGITRVAECGKALNTKIASAYITEVGQTISHHRIYQGPPARPQNTWLFYTVVSMAEKLRVF